MARILLVDDDEYYRGALKLVLQQRKHEIVEAGDGKGAQHIFGLQPFDLVITDIRMPYMSGVQLLSWVKQHSKVPVVLITGFSEIMETHQASQLGADGFLLKPFNAAEIDQLIESLTARLPVKEPDPAIREDLDAKYRKIPIEDFVSGSKMSYAIYIRVSNTHYVRIAHKGEDVVVERVRAYREKGVTHLYMSKEDFCAYVDFNLTLASRITGAASISDEKKRNFIRHSAEVILEHVFVAGADRVEFDAAKEFVGTVLEVAQESDEIFLLLDALNSHADFIYAHSLGVSLYGSMMARAMGWHSTPVRFKVSLAGLLHDIGLKEVARSIVIKGRVEMSQSERSDYESHPTRGMELLSRIRGIPDDVIQVAAHHHEDSSGTGYPSKIARGRIHPLARLLSVADLFCEYAIKGPDRLSLPALETIHYMGQNRSYAMDPACFAALRKVFGA